MMKTWDGVGVDDQVASNGPQVSLHHPRWLTSSGSWSNIFLQETRGCQRCIKGCQRCIDVMKCHGMFHYVSSPHALQSDTCCAKPEAVQSVQGMFQVTTRVAWLNSALKFTTKGQSTRLHAAATADSMILLCHLSLCESTARCICSQAKT